MPDTPSQTTEIGVFIPSYVGGGAERMGVFVAEALANAGYKTDLVVSCSHGELRDRLRNAPPKGVELVDLEASTEFLALPQYLGYLKRRKPKLVISLVHTSNLTSGLGRWLNKQVKTVVTIHSTVIREPDDQWFFRRYFGHKPEGCLYRHCEKVIAVCDGLAREVETAFNLDANSVGRIYNPMLNNAHQDDAIAPEHETIFEKPVVLGVGRLVKLKNFDQLIDAFAHSASNHNANLLILGEGPERDPLTERIKARSLEGRVFLPGWTPQPGAYMRRAHSVALTSRFEGFGLVCVEALAAGAGVISVDCPHGPREILDHGRLGRLIEPNDIEAFAAAITEELALPTSPRQDIIAERQEWLSQFAPETAAQQYIETVESLIGKPGRNA